MPTFRVTELLAPDFLALPVAWHRLLAAGKLVTDMRSHRLSPSTRRIDNCSFQISPESEGTDRGVP